MNTLQALTDTIEQRKLASPKESYVASLYQRPLDGLLKKITEESTEVIMAAKDNDSDHVVREMADLWFHCLVLLARFNLDHNAVWAELQRREGTSGHLEKQSRNTPKP